MRRGVQALLGVGRNTVDLDRALVFHRDALGFRVDAVADDAPAWTRLPGVDAQPSRWAHLSLGTQQIELTEFTDAAAYPADSTSCDLGFQHCAIVVDDMRATYDRVMAHGARPITLGGPQTLPPSTGSVAAFKFRDPDGHPLDLIEFPAGTGDPTWQRAATTRTTLGVDHSAISVADIERCVRFYELLGLHMASRGVNRGRGQQRLDDLAHVVVDVIAMQPAAARTPHLELLGYRQPRGRRAPASAITAIADDRLVCQASDTDRLLEAIRDAGLAAAILASGRPTGETTALLRDPDGHVLLLGETDDPMPTPLQPSVRYHPVSRRSNLPTECQTVIVSKHGCADCEYGVPRGVPRTRTPTW